MLQIILMVAAVWLMIKLWSVFLVLVIALLLAGTMSPVVTWMEGRGTNRGLAIGVAFSVMFLVGLGLAMLTLPSFLTQAAALIEREPEFRRDIASYLALSKLTAPIAGWLRHLKYSTPAMITSDTAFAVSLRIIETLAYAVSAIFLAVYIMLDRDRLRGALFAMVPRSHHIRLARVILNLETIVGAYIRGQMVTCVIIAVFSFVLLMLCGVPNPLALAVFAGVADVLP
ncbi:MAG: AI-2E family transporter, partial [Vicinamibacteria bacterium]